MGIRTVKAADYAPIAEHLDEWWDGRAMLDMLPRLFFEHFASTSFAFEADGAVAGFLIGFMSPTHPEQAYVHFVGVHPDHRGRRIAKRLYERFFDEARAHGRKVVRCVTSPANRGSIAFHTNLGFEVLPGDAEIDGIAVSTDYDGPGQDRVGFSRSIA
ncbi:GNAT family N-acetyltransferase [Gulosibacter sp. 10]|uniref:GNAT family N-acetyltransferase n=1 Tax=Gulosibacter sp. 10 TaxID=1255570 RepID=UPI00097F3651|nr:GNAT family N-acetyltransferase [Gulosibacter sp. 10]SJM56957.1 acetyltransferase, GNAT family [Gulosibacter sp. 10]